MDSIICGRCNGSGYESFWDGRWETDACYHCCNTGYIDPETAYHDKVAVLADKMAYMHVRWIYSDPQDSEDTLEFAAAESMMSPSDYFEGRVCEYSYFFQEKLMNMKPEELEFLFAWQENNISWKPEEEKEEKLVHQVNLNSVSEYEMQVWGDEILF
jgi:hypothetical protein